MSVYIPENVKIFDAAVLKWIAIITMAVDHTAAAVVNNCFIKPNTPIVKGSSIYELYQFYKVLRGIGRLAFPIFCFFLVEGFIYTRSRKKYLFRLFVFGLLSELPFDLGLFRTLQYEKHQNVMFELALGLLLLCIWEEIWKIERLNPGIRALLQGLAIAGIMYFAYWQHLDYGFKGIGLIMLLYLLRSDRVTQCTCGAIFISLFEWQAVFAFPLLCLYNGKRGKQHKYLFYWFYPVHLMALYGIASLILGSWL